MKRIILHTTGLLVASYILIIGHQSAAIDAASKNTGACIIAAGPWGVKFTETGGLEFTNEGVPPNIFKKSCFQVTLDTCKSLGKTNAYYSQKSCSTVGYGHCCNGYLISDPSQCYPKLVSWLDPPPPECNPDKFTDNGDVWEYVQR